MEELEQQRVVAVRVVTEEGQVLEENPAGLPLQRGEPFASDKIRESLRWLHASGRFAEIRAEATEVTGGLRLDFVVQRNFYVNEIHVEGLRPPPTEAAAVATLVSAGLSLGEIFRESLLEESLERLRQVLQEEGHYQPQFTHELRPNEETRQMDIVVRVEPGPRARISAIPLHNETSFPDVRLLARSKLKPGQEVTSARLERAAERVRKYLTDRGHLGARVSIRRSELTAGTNTLPLVMEISAGPRVRVEVNGARISSGEMRKLLPIYEEAAVDEDLLQEGRRNIRDYLEKQGYFDSQVSFTRSEDLQKGEHVIRYDIARGPRRRLLEVAFEGNRYFSHELLFRRLRLRPAALIDRGRFSRRLVDEDRESIRQLYVANGFRQVKVEAEVVEDYRGREGDLFVRFRIEEGPQTRVAEFELAGNETLDAEFLLEHIGSTPGQPYSEFNVLTDRDSLLALYFNEGFPEARFDAEMTELDGEPSNRVRLLYRITEGPQRKVARVLLDGYEHTRSGVIAREVQLTPGEPLREGAVVETQRRLYNLGLFSRVQIAPQNPRGADPDKALVVLVEEAKRYTIAYGGGVEVQRLGGAGTDPVEGEVRASPRGIFEFSRANFEGRPHTLSFKARASTLQGRALVGYTAQNFLARRELSLLLSGFADKTRDVSTFTATRYEASGQLVQQVSPISSLFYRYSFRRVSVSDLKISESQIPLFSQPTKISSLGFSWIRDRRDSPAEATRGTFHNADISFAGKPIGSSASFLRLFLHQASFHPLRGRVVFARSLRVGIQEPLGDTVAEQIPLPERFFAGGGNSLRGFGLNQAGPRDPLTGFPVGGLALLVFNQEIRFPMRLPYVGDRVGGALFYDAGNVFRRTNRITLRVSPPAPQFDPSDPTKCLNCNEMNYFSHTIGFGFRYATPIGPVRIDLGYQLNPATFEFCTESVGASAGRCPADQELRRARLPRFQFFFNIGSIF